MKLQLAKNTLALKRSSMWLIFALFMLSALGVVHFSLFEAFGLKVHANLLASIVFHQELPPALKQRDFLVFLACGVGLCIWLPKASPLGASALAFAASAATFIVAYHNAVPSGVVPLEFTLLTILVLFSTHVLLGYFFETHEKQKIIAMFGQFVPPTVVDQIAAAFSDRGEYPIGQAHCSASRMAWMRAIISARGASNWPGRASRYS